MIVLRQPQEILEATRSNLGLPPLGSPTDVVSDQFLAAVIRHSAGFLCPCSGATIRSVVMESLRYLVTDTGLAERIDDVIERLIIVGDLLELSHATTSDAIVRGTWIFAAPPGYVVRPGGKIFLTGIVSDRDTYLPLALSERIQNVDFTRTLAPNPNEDLAVDLAELGLQQISQDTWLKCPREQSAAEFLSICMDKLYAGSHSSDIPDLQILNSDSPVTYYKGRWVSPKKHSGVFVARRPQEYGAPIWCFVELENGDPKYLLDFPLRNTPWRGCDSAWHLQSAIDSERGTPQQYRLRSTFNGTYLDFFSPLPLWAHRRLMVVGQKASPDKCLISFRIPESEVEEEERFLRQQLWLRKIEK